MASQKQVRDYLAYWFQLGKGVVIRNGSSACRPKPVLQGDRLSPAFEDCWSDIMASGGSDCYLESTSVTLDQLLTEEWEVSACSRCQLPIAVPVIAYSTQPCTCNDLENWPNFEVPYPHLPVDSQGRLTNLRARLQTKGTT